MADFEDRKLVTELNAKLFEELNYPLTDRERKAELLKQIGAVNKFLKKGDFFDLNSKDIVEFRNAVDQALPNLPRRSKEFERLVSFAQKLNGEMKMFALTDIPSINIHAHRNPHLEGKKEPNIVSLPKIPLSAHESPALDTINPALLSKKGKQVYTLDGELDQRSEDLSDAVRSANSSVGTASVSSFSTTATTGGKFSPSAPSSPATSAPSSRRPSNARRITVSSTKSESALMADVGPKSPKPSGVSPRTQKLKSTSMSH
jgi:hypothetical protein